MKVITDNILYRNAEGVTVKYRIGKDRQMAPRGDYCAYMLKAVSIYVKIVLYTHKKINKQQKPILKIITHTEYMFWHIVTF